MRSFWFRADPATGDRVDDIVGIQRWEAGSALGAPQHRPGGVDGSDLVLVFRGRLFHRYPATLLYLLSARHGGVVDFARPPADGARRTLPTFQGRIGADVTFFGFVGVDPEEAEAALGGAGGAAVGLPLPQRRGGRQRRPWTARSSPTSRSTTRSGS